MQSEICSGSRLVIKIRSSAISLSHAFRQIRGTLCGVLDAKAQSLNLFCNDGLITFPRHLTRARLEITNLDFSGNRRICSENRSDSPIFLAVLIWFYLAIEGERGI